MKRSQFLGGAVGVALAPIIAKLPSSSAPKPSPHAWPQGAPLPAEFVGAGESSTTTLAADWGRVNARRFPLLARALKEERPAQRCRVEWIEDICVDRRIGRILRWNNTQIFRVPKTLGGRNEATIRRAAFDELLAQIEQTLRYGARSGLNHDTPDFSVFPLTTMGGTRELLGRDAKSGDLLRLRTLRGPQWRRFEWAGKTTGEWLAEVSLEVRPG
jgi:hypothetical protein